MKVTGIVCEYNPFHNGHIYHIQKTKEITNPDILVCVMSGNFVQRGEAAIIDKWERAKCAIEHGVDLVLELPYIYATQSAAQFAKGSIDVLKLAQIDSIVFGSESNDLQTLLAISKKEDFLTTYKKEGISSAKAYEQMYGSVYSNDILGINYLKQIQDTNINAYTIQRTNHYLEEHLNERISSATSIRKAIYNKEGVTNHTPMHHIEDTFQMKYYFPYIKMMLLTTPKERLSQYFLMDEGIESHFIKNVKLANDYEEFMSLSTSKRYTRASIQRTLLHLLTQTTKQQVNILPELNYIRVLAYNDTGKQYLKQLKKQGINIASRFNQIPEVYRDMELKAAHVYAYPLAIENQNTHIQKELQPPIYIPNKK